MFILDQLNTRLTFSVTDVCGCYCSWEIFYVLVDESIASTDETLEEKEAGNCGVQEHCIMITNKVGEIIVKCFFQEHVDFCTIIY